MSSHHIVREKQEPALLVLNMDNFDRELLGQLLEWSPTVIATNDTAEQLTSLGIKVDRILSKDGVENIQSDLKYLPTNAIPPLQTAFNFLISENYAAVNIVSSEFNADDYTSFVPRINQVILHQRQKTYPISSGFTKWLPAGEVIYLHTQPKDLETNGLSPLGNGKYITLLDGVIKLEFADDFIFISETI